MFKKLVLRNRSVLNGGQKAVANGRRASVSQLQSFSTSNVSEFRRTDGPKADSVQEAIRILNEGNNAAILADNLLTSRLNDFEKLIIEAKQSISDCMDTSNIDEELLDEDREDAKDAVREAIDVFSDISHSFKKSFEDGTSEQSEVIQKMASQLEELKNELESVLDETKRGNFIVGLNNIMNRIVYWKN
mmetsp:Transcript_5689/g.6989  ORF Transcript_5689/g.6989 Transcript_5689/m.6989 type:complete len:189 (+) Transcript_5689:99-665(+)|eukprot:CAMPEP_0203668926 /NCGR_PEP_ID=MMETSP0090-20130426/5421_1 /ASSEMBLY_ACC=CAM_ASM_001088 /TAXON_ID=426623 /ORGANISM="Chaetoceros affinis, Strain CCMP159" /LENGTH=188 /DNA_ID=CAMNT_0050533481 /DNA_START=88 /DNA_END=654 /DNA_ORIENTATION=-